MRRSTVVLWAVLCLAALGFAGPAPAESDGDSASAPATDAAPADQTPAVATASSREVHIELNKLQAVPDACRAYLVTQNLSDRVFASFKLDVVMFDDNGIVAKRLAVQLGPMPAGKTSLKVFDIPDLGCQKIGQLLLNGVLDCTVDTGKGSPQRRDDCLSMVSVSQRGSVPFIQ